MNQVQIIRWHYICVDCGETRRAASLRFWTARYAACARCGGKMVPVASPNGRLLAHQFYGNKVQITATTRDQLLFNIAIIIIVAAVILFCWAC